MINIKSIQKTTLIDFPGHIAMTLFVGGCNFNCIFCYNQALLNPAESTAMSDKAIFSVLNHRRRLIDGIVITGGEPTLQPQLPIFLEQVKHLGYLTKLDTNGSNPDMISYLLAHRLIDYIAMDIKASPENYQAITQIKFDNDKIFQSIQLIQHAEIPYEFRSTVWQESYPLTEFIRMVAMIEGAKQYYIQNFANPTGKSMPGFTPFTHAAIQPYLAEAKKHVQRVDLRGWS